MLVFLQEAEESGAVMGEHVGRIQLVEGDGVTVGVAYFHALEKAFVKDGGKPERAVDVKVLRRCAAELFGHGDADEVDDSDLVVQNGAGRIGVGHVFGAELLLIVEGDSINQELVELLLGHKLVNQGKELNETALQVLFHNVRAEKLRGVASEFDKISSGGEAHASEKLAERAWRHADSGCVFSLAALRKLNQVLQKGQNVHKSPTISLLMRGSYEDTISPPSIIYCEKIINVHLAVKGKRSAHFTRRKGKISSRYLYNS